MHRAWQEDKYKGAYTPNNASELVLESCVCLWSCPTSFDMVWECESCHMYDFNVDTRNKDTGM